MTRFRDRRWKAVTCASTGRQTIMELPSFRVVRRTQENLQILEPSGRITLGQSVRELKQSFDLLAQEGHRRLIVNMVNVAYVDSAGLGTLITGLNTFRKADGTLVLSNLQPRVAQLLELTNLTGVLETFPTEEAAVESMKLSQSRPL